MDMFGSEGVGGDGRHSAGVDAARETHGHVAEAVLADVVTCRHHQRLPDLLQRVEWRRQHVLSSAAAGRVADLQFADSDVFAEGREPAHHAAVRVGDERVAVEDQLVLPAHLVDVDDGDAERCCPRPCDRLPVVLFAPPVRRSVHHHHQLCPHPYLGQHRAGVVFTAESCSETAVGCRGVSRARRPPQILAHRDAHAYIADVQQRPRLGPRHEVALLVEHGVVRQQVLAIHAAHFAVRAHRHRVPQPHGSIQPGVLRKAHHSRHRPGMAGDPLERRRRPRHKRRLQQQVLRRIPSNGQLTEHHHLGSEPNRRVIGVHDHQGIPVEIPQPKVQLGQPHTHDRHKAKPYAHPSHPPRVREHRRAEATEQVIGTLTRDRGQATATTGAAAFGGRPARWRGGQREGRT